MKKLHWIILGVIAVLSLVVDVYEFLHHESTHGWYFPGFWILFGAVGCGVLILFGKKVLGLFLYQKEDYYND
ncbi:MAG: hypothetical protein GY765_40290 [bacterium]|nr:hypothetical protein [bacterium]